MKRIVPEQWTLLDKLAGGSVFALAHASSGEDLLLFAATASGVAQAHVDAGYWQLAGETQPLLVETLAVSPTYARDQTLYAGTPVGAFQSVDGGQSWRPVLLGARITALALADGQERPIVFAGTEHDGLFCSHDGGRNWASANVGLLDLSVLACALSPAFSHDGVGYVGTLSGLYRTRNGGAVWRPLSLPIDDPVVSCLAVSPHFVHDARIWAGLDDAGLFCSHDGGQHWQRVTLGDPAESVSALAVDMTGQRIAVATGTRVFFSEERGQRWQLLGELPDLGLCLDLVPDGGTVSLFAGCARQGVWRWNHPRHEWQLASDGLVAFLPTGLAVCAGTGDAVRVVRALLDGGLATSDQPGGQWETVVPFAHRLLFELVQVEYPGRLYVLADDGVWVSQDGGQTFARCSSGPTGGRVLAARSLSRDRDAVLVVTADGTWWYSEDGGRHWHSGAFGYGQTVRAASLVRWGDSVMLLLGTTGIDEAGSLQGTLWWSEDTGRSWRPWLTLDGVSSMLLAVASDPSRQEVFVGAGNGLFRAAPQRREALPPWEYFPCPTARPVTALAISPAYEKDGLVGVACGRDVWLFASDPVRWIPWSDGLATTAILKLGWCRTASASLLFALDAQGNLWGRQLIA